MKQFCVVKIFVVNARNVKHARQLALRGAMMRIVDITVDKCERSRARALSFPRGSIPRQRRMK